MDKKQNLIPYKQTEINRILNSKTFWDSMEYLHTIFHLGDYKGEALELQGATKYLEDTCAEQSIDILRPGDDVGSLKKRHKTFLNLLIDRHDWWGYALYRAFEFVMLFCDITEEKSLSPETATALRKQELAWDIGWKEAIARCIIKPNLKKIFYDKKQVDETTKKLFTIHMDTADPKVEYSPFDSSSSTPLLKNILNACALPNDDWSDKL